MELSELQAIAIKLRILDQIIREARDAGDERWHEPARQAAQLNARRAELLRQQRERDGIPEPPAQRINATVGRMGAKGEKPHG